MIFRCGRNPEAQQGFAKINEYMVHVYPYSVTGHTLASFLLAIAKNDEKGGVVFFFFPEELNASFQRTGSRTAVAVFIRTDTYCH